MFEAARLGDQAAIVALLAIAQPDIRRYARAACRGSADAEDAAQEALWLLFRRVGSIRSLAAVSRWLFVVVRRECLRLARRAGLVPTEPIDGIDLERTFASRPDIEIRLDIAAAMEALPAQYREIALMRDVREMTIDEIAGERGLSREAVKARLHRARMMMREYLAR
ncbi:sigma-70 family RNA polymerase sigma factor [Phreatobacter stygius]|uniref:Sigma-70 family RNA polymerase sigma factor n=1 Tax=Phreatobacter stygius TaxID=1940610 RepID=A0A4D7BFC8_9HYPH|nr:sigma-70 family RNA polymerase sigma factor [Phreatobacter stygius]